MTGRQRLREWSTAGGKSEKTHLGETNNVNRAAMVIKKTEIYMLHNSLGTDALNLKHFESMKLCLQYHGWLGSITVTH